MKQIKKQEMIFLKLCQALMPRKEKLCQYFQKFNQPSILISKKQFIHPIFTSINNETYPQQNIKLKQWTSYCSHTNRQSITLFILESSIHIIISCYDQPIIFHNKMERDQIKWDLQLIFVYYSSFADRNNYKLLKQQNYRRLLIDCECVQQEGNFAHFDIAFQKLSHSAIIFKDFLKLIPEIAEITYKQSKTSRAQAFKKFINNNIAMVYREILNKSDYGHDLQTTFNLEMDVNLYQKLNDIQAIHKIYQDYLKPVSHKEPIIIFEKLALLLKDFQISPQIISKAFLYILFLFILRQKQEEFKQSIYTVREFVQTLIYIAEVNSGKLQSQELCSLGKITKLFQRIQISSGFDLLSKKVSTENNTTTFQLLKSLYRLIRNGQLESDHCLEKQHEQFNRMFPSSTRHKHCNDNDTNDYFLSVSNKSRRQHKKQELKMENFMSVQSVANQSKVFHKDFREIRQAFQDLCSYGEVANNKTLKSFKIKKLFQRIGLLKLTGTAWLDIQIVNLQRSSQSGKIQFLQFLELLSLAAQKTLCTFDEICLEILQDKQLTERERIDQKSYNSCQSNQNTVYRESDLQLLKQIVKNADKPLTKIYSKYCEDLRSQQLLTFNQLSRMMYDLQVFPGIISKNKLYQIFSEMNDIRQETKESDYPLNYKSVPKNYEQKQLNLREIKKIEYSGFLMGLINIAQEIVEPDLQPPQKLILLLEKINESRGYKKLTNLSLVQQIRNRFSKYYLNSFHRHQKKSQQTFDELLNIL